MPTALRLAGHRFFFHSDEGNEPPHMHVEQAENVAKFWLGPPVGVVTNKGFNGSELRRVQRMVEEHLDELMRVWNDYQARKQ